MIIYLLKYLLYKNIFSYYKWKSINFENLVSQYKSSLFLFTSPILYIAATVVIYKSLLYTHGSFLFYSNSKTVSLTESATILTA